MRKFRHITLIFISLLSTTLMGQISKKIIDNNLKLGKNTIYVVNGLPYEPEDSIKLDSALNSYPQKHILEITKLTAGNGQMFCINNDVAVIYFATQQSKKVIKKELKKIKEIIYKKNTSKSAKPTLIVDNKNIDEKEFQSIIKTLKISDIYFIENKTEQHNTAKSDEKAKNGLIRIITKEEKTPSP